VNIVLHGLFLYFRGRIMKITIIGGGASGTLLAVNLLRQNTGEELRISIVEKRGAHGGVAFSTPFDFHLLNVPAAKMSGLVDEPNHFLEWLTEEGHDFGPTDFVPRHLFGNYLRSLLDKTISESVNGKLDIVRDEATNIETGQDCADVVLRSGERLRSDRVVLAFGNFLPPHPSVYDLKFTSAEKYVHDVWAPDAFGRIKGDDDILIIGTGLSMVDVVLRLRSTAHTGKVYALSTHGLLPAVHRLGHQYDSFYPEIKGAKRITDIFKRVRHHIQLAESDSSDWRAVVDSLRPHTQEIWQGLPDAEKRYFLQHLSRHWNAARHRMPPQASKILDELRAEGKLDLLSGRLRHISIDDAGRFLVNYAAKGEQSYLAVDVLINCIGSESNFSRINSELIQNLLTSGTIRCDSIKQGLDAAPDGRLIDGSGQPSELIRAIGTALKGTLWETTAIPEIRAQARDLAARLSRPAPILA
jgi:uncharacterized NAD(P)/FAD-binding protein YdhS